MGVHMLNENLETNSVIMDDPAKLLAVKTVFVEVCIKEESDSSSIYYNR